MNKIHMSWLCVVHPTEFVSERAPIGDVVDAQAVFIVVVSVQTAEDRAVSAAPVGRGTRA
jgi:hypothetical protein